MSATRVAHARPAVSTPGWLLRAMLGLVALAAVAAGGALGAARSAADAAQTVGRDAEPSVALGLRMVATLRGMDAATLADALTDGGAATGTSARFADGLDQLAADVVAASRNITYGEAEAAPLRELQRMVALYVRATAEVRGVGPGDPALMSSRLQWASRVARDFAVPQAAALAAANADQLESHYAAYRAGSLLTGGLACAGFALLVAALLAVQAWLARRTRRLLNPALAAATLLAGACGLWFAGAMLGERADLRAAKSDAYDSLQVLFAAKGEASGLQADTSLWLLDPAARAAAQADILAKEHALFDAPIAAALPALHRAQALEDAGQPAAALAAVPHTAGLLGAELDNVTFGPAERDPATQSLERLLDMEALVTLVEQRAAQSGTVARWLRDGAAGFDALQAALDRTIAVNQGEFDRRVSSALRGAALIPAVSALAMAAVALLSVGGLWLRLREYR